jgi:DNA-binding NtrC family response regulator
VKPSILYLDDEAQCLDVFRETFKNDYHVRTAATSDEAHLLLAECPSEIVISDQYMPEVSGAEFLRAVAEKHPRSCRVMLTGNTMVGAVMREMAEGIFHLFVTKPWTEESMVRALERASLYARLR